MSTSYLQHHNFPSERPLTSHTAIAVRSQERNHKAPPEESIKIAEVPLDRCLTTTQAATILGRSIDVLKKWRLREGKGPDFIRFPDGGIRYRLSVIMKFMDTCTVKR